MSGLLLLGLLVTVMMTMAVTGAPDATARTAHMLDGPSWSPPTATAAQRRQQGIAAGPLGMNGNWNLILNSQFAGRSLDTSLWQPGWFGNGITGPINDNELACYSPANVSLPGDGTLHLKVTEISSTCKGVQRPYTGAVLSTNPRYRGSGDGFQYTYGALQARVDVPRSGLEVANWPAVLTLGQDWPRDGENDILESLEGTVCAHFHSLVNVNPGLGTCDRYMTPGWHTIASDWEPGSVTWYYDGAEIGRITEGVTAAPMYIVIVNTVSVKGPAVTRPDTMRVAYVRVWQHPTSPTG